jgi:hypothetical protein
VFEERRHLGRRRDEARRKAKCKTDLATCGAAAAPAGSCDGAQVVRCAGTVADYQKCAVDWNKLYTTYADTFSCEGLYDGTLTLPKVLPESCDTLFRGCESDSPFGLAAR